MAGRPSIYPKRGRRNRNRKKELSGRRHRSRMNGTEIVERGRRKNNALKEEEGFPDEFF